MTTESLARSLIGQARQRLTLLPHAMELRAWHIVIREAQECMELALKGLLRACALEPPKIHDLAAYLLENKERILQVRASLAVERMAEISKRWRSERELSFYGDVDFLPDEKYTERQASEAMQDAAFCIEQAESAL